MRKGNNDLIYPVPWDKSLVYLKNVINDPDIKVGDHTYYHDFENDPRDFVKNNVLYHAPDILFHDDITIGKYCSIASGVKFICQSANHDMDMCCLYPFVIFNEHWALPDEMFSMSFDRVKSKKGATVIGNDVWIGHDAVIMPGVKIGDGAIIGTKSLVSRDVEPYTVVAGNPARPVRKRFDQATINRLLEMKWWDLPDEEVRALVPDMIDGKLEKVLSRGFFGDTVDRVLAGLDKIK